MRDAPSDPTAADPRGAGGGLPVPGPTSIAVPVPSGSGAVDVATAIARALVALGVRDLVLAPGSRSAPLVYSLADPEVAAGLRAHVRIDERAAAFTALGISRADPTRPAAVLTTSGTATAHLLAAVMEAHHSRVPLIVLTADRPAELRGTGANQTTEQVGLYRSFVRSAADLPAPTAGRATAVELRTAVSTVARAVAVARGAHPGPVHLNLGFRDPLVPGPGSHPLPVRDADGKDPRIVLTRQPPPAAPPAHRLDLGPRTVVVAGDGAGPAARALAEQHGLPLLAEPSSGARGGPQLVPGYPGLLAAVMADPDHPLRPDRAVVLGRPTLQRSVVGALLGAPDVEVVVVHPYPDYPDAARRAALVLPALDAPRPGPAERARRAAWTAAWQGAEPPADPAGLPWQARAALAVWDAAGAGDLLVLGSSSLVRDLDRHAGGTDARVVAGRGLAGIDGTTSFAGGLALAAAGVPDPRRVRLLVGDLTALHDLTGLVIGPEEQVPELDVIVVDDDGGRIFGGLEHAAAPPALLRRFFTTPHGTDLVRAAQGLGATARALVPGELPAALREPASGMRVLVVHAPEVLAAHAQVTSSDLPGNPGEGTVD